MCNSTIRCILIVTLLFALFTAAEVTADVSLPKLIASHMLLQRGAAAKIWGTADVGEKVSVEFRGQKLEVTADAKGDWLVKLQPMKAGGPFEMTIAGKNTIKLTDILIGDVWVCSGQSNMAMRVRSCMNQKEEAKAADHPNIRFFAVRKMTADAPQKNVGGGSWQACTPITVKNFSGVGYFFGRDLHKELNVPIGLIESDWGGTPAQSWTSSEALDTIPEFSKIRDQWKQTLDAYPAANEKYKPKYNEWRKAVKKAKDEGKPAPRRRPRQPQGPDSPHRPSNLYNAMIAPVTNHTITGAIWYQGESDASRAMLYRKLLPTMIKCWRTEWEQPDFPFIVVQLANYMSPTPKPRRSAWAELREAQSMTVDADPNVGIAVAIDVGEAKDIHPANKQTVGKRLALWALANVHKKQIVGGGPAFDSMRIEGGKVRVKFTHVGGGLAVRTSAKPNRTNFNADPNYKFTLGDGPIKGFAVAGEDQVFEWAEAKFEGDTVVLSSDKVAKPVAVRYAWANNPDCNLYNAEGLPAGPFRTDKWDKK